MTAQCKVLHLLSSQSDYLKKSVISFKSVRVCVCYLREALVARGSEIRGNNTTRSRLQSNFPGMTPR